jgi:opacity protein-like surface antigen
LTERAACTGYARAARYAARTVDTRDISLQQPYKRVSKCLRAASMLRAPKHQEINMLRKNSILVCTAIAAALGVPVVASAADTGFYIGALAGTSSYDAKRSEWDAAAADLMGPDGTVDSTSLDKSDTAFGAVLGYQFMRNFGVEAYYLDLGKLKANATGTIATEGGDLDATIDGKFESSGPALALVAAFPFSEGWLADVRAGIYYGDTKIKITGSASGPGGTATLEPISESQSRSTFMAGAGVGYSFGNNVSVRLDYLYFDDLGIKRTDLEATSNANVFTLGVRYMFGG